MFNYYITLMSIPHVPCNVCLPYPALELIPNDPKSLFRRCQAYEQLGNVEEAYRDAMLLLKVDPRNTAIQPVLGRLNPAIQDKVLCSYFCESFHSLLILLPYTQYLPVQMNVLAAIFDLLAHFAGCKHVYSYMYLVYNTFVVNAKC